jgi:hypothetical protein
VDPSGLLEAVLAVAVYPGAAYLILAALLHRLVAGRPSGLGSPGPVPAATLLPVIAATVATAMLPMTGSPALRLPPATGVAPNVVALAVLLAVAVDLGGSSKRVSLLAAAAAVPILALAANQATLSAVAVSTSGGGTGLAARSLAAAILVLAAASTAGGRAASVVVAALALTGASLVIPAALADAPPIACAAASLGVVALGGAVARLSLRWPSTALTGAGLAAAAGGSVLAFLSNRV